MREKCRIDVGLKAKAAVRVLSVLSVLSARVEASRGLFVAIGRLLRNGGECGDARQYQRSRRRR